MGTKGILDMQPIKARIMAQTLQSTVRPEGEFLSN
jgi:hypothetical protein